MAHRALPALALLLLAGLVALPGAGAAPALPAAPAALAATAPAEGPGPGVAPPLPGPVHVCPILAACASVQLCQLFVVGPCFHATGPAGLEAVGYCGLLLNSALGLPAVVCAQTATVGTHGESASLGASAGRACYHLGVLLDGWYNRVGRCLPA